MDLALVVAAAVVGLAAFLVLILLPNKGSVVQFDEATPPL
jgi:hypothetical protein